MGVHFFLSECLAILAPFVGKIFYHGTFVKNQVTVRCGFISGISVHFH